MTKVAPAEDEDRANLAEAAAATTVDHHHHHQHHEHHHHHQEHHNHHHEQHKEHDHAHHPTAHGPSLRTLLPQVINEQNRKTYGTWQRQFDFTRTIIGYLLGIHNFFRFPYLCYKHGGIFFIPYVLMMIFFGIPVVFMEFTIGQYYGVGSYVAFTQMAPILSCVSKILTWSCVVNAWMFTVIMAWLRIYSSEATSCQKGWEVCNSDFYFNSPHCFTGSLDDECSDPSLAGVHNLSQSFVLENDLIFYNFGCITVGNFCKLHNWEEIPGKRYCIDQSGKEHSIYERRFHATQEYLYGAVLGLNRNMEEARHELKINETLTQGGFANIDALRDKVYNKSAESRLLLRKLKYKPSASETVETYLREIKKSSNDTERAIHKSIYDKLVGPDFQERYYWNKHGVQLRVNEESSSEVIIQRLSLTTWIMIGVFLFEDLLTVSFLSYLLNAVPFALLVYITSIAVSFQYSGFGIDELLRSKVGFFEDLMNLEMWADACIQVIYTSGIGNGVLISLATYNNFDHAYLFDLYFTLSCSVITSCCGVLICFCSLGHYMKQYNIDVPFREYIKSESSTSSVEFCFITYAHFLTLISERHVITIWFFFMVNSFATDSVIRVVQNVLDAIITQAPRLRSHPTMVLIAVCLMGYFMNVPIMKNGSIVLYIDFEYFTIRYIVPTIIFMEIVASIFIYKASRIMDHAEQMCVFSSTFFRYYMTAMMFLSSVLILGAIIINVVKYKGRHLRFNWEEEQRFTEIFGWVFYVSPLLMVFLSIIKQLIVVPRSRWGWLIMPFQGKDRKVRRAFLRRIQEGHDDQQEVTDNEMNEPTARWRTLESRLILAMMEHRREEQLHRKKERERRKEESEKEEELQGEPLFMQLVRAAAVAKTANPEDETDRQEDEEGEKDKDRERRKAFLHVTKNTWFTRLKAAFMGKVSKSGTYIPRRHIGGIGHSRIVTKLSEDGSHVMHFDHEDDQESIESLSHDDDIGAEEELKLKYLNYMDYIERWPGRLDESEIESEGSSDEPESELEDTDEEEQRY